MTTAQARRRRQIEQIWMGRVTLALLIALAVWALITNDKNDKVQRDLTATTNQNRVTLCGAARILTASPNVYIPEFETKEQFQQISQARRDFLSLVRDINCSVILAGALPPRSEGGGQQSSPNTGSQLPGGLRAPRPSHLPARQARRVPRVQLDP